MDTTSGKKVRWVKEPNPRNDKEDLHWSHWWYPETEGREVVLSACILRVGGQYFLSYTHSVIPHEHDIGPFDRFGDAKKAAELMILLKQYPPAWGACLEEYED